MSVALSDRFADKVRDELAKLIAARTNRLVRETSERNAGFVQGLEEALRLVEAAYQTVNNER